MKIQELNDELKNLSWHNDRNIQTVSMEKIVEHIREQDIGALIQNGDKSCWENEAHILCKIGFPVLKALVPRLFEWLKDMNWPGAKMIFDFLLESNHEFVLDGLKESLKKSLIDKDNEWLENLREFIESGSISKLEFGDDLLWYDIFSSAE